MTSSTNPEPKRVSKGNPRFFAVNRDSDEDFDKFRRFQTIPTRKDAIFRLNNARSLRQEQIEQLKSKNDVIPVRKNKSGPPAISISLLRKTLLANAATRELNGLLKRGDDLSSKESNEIENLCLNIF